jgi:hypothetical protein
MEPGSASSASTVRSFQASGWGSQVPPVPPVFSVPRVPPGPAVKPNGGRSPDHGNGTRQPSRPVMVCPERCHIGSCRSSPGMSSTSHRPSSSPW